MKEKNIFLMRCASDAVANGCRTNNEIVDYCKEHYGLLDKNIKWFLMQQRSNLDWQLLACLASSPDK
jgi:hypothetical protein